MRVVAALAAAVLLLGAGPDAARGVSEIVFTECHFGYEPHGYPGLRGFVLKPDGSVLRVTTPKRDEAVIPMRGESADLKETANVGPAAFHALAGRFVRSQFFARGAARLQQPSIGIRGMRISVTRDGRRTVWSVERVTATADDAMFFRLYMAAYDVVGSRRLRWREIRSAEDPLAICGSTRNW